VGAVTSMSSAGRTADSPAENAFVVELTGFAGPLELLLTLIREEQIDIYDIPIARIAEQFVLRIRTLELNEAADYLEMAARLLRIKAQMLLPRGEEELWEDPRAELVRRLLEYQQIREIALWMGRSAERRSEQYARGYLPPPPVFPPPPLTLDIMDLLQAVERVIAAIPSPVLHKVVARPLDVEGATRRIEALLESQSEIGWLEALGPRPTIVDLLSTLLAILELAKRGALRISQPAPFSPMVIARDATRPAA
jgi:segregation and condensation protein A